MKYDFSQKYVEVLQIDGGGIMLMTAMPSLRKLEEQAPGKRLCNIINLIYGESTGAIAGVCIAAGASIDELWQLYEIEGEHIFKPQYSWFNIFKKLSNPLYDRQRVLGPLGELLSKYGVATMADLKTYFVAGTVNVLTKQNVFQKSWRSEYRHNDPVNNVNRSFAAPIAFGPVVDEIARIVYMDGGTGGQNCSLRRSVDEAQVMKAEGLFDKELGIRVFSFGTGYSNTSLDFETARSLSVFRQLYDVVFDRGLGLARSQAVVDQVTTMQWLQRKLGKHVYDVRRIDTFLPAYMNRLDGIQYIDEYIRLGWNTALTNQDILKFD